MYIYILACMYMHTYKRFQTMLECSFKSRLVALQLQRCKCANESLDQQNSHGRLQWLNSRGGGVSTLSSKHYPPPPRVGLYKSIVSFPCVCKADWWRKSRRSGTSSGIMILHWLIFLQSLLLCWIY